MNKLKAVRCASDGVQIFTPHGDDIVKATEQIEFSKGFNGLRKFVSRKEIYAYLADAKNGARFIGSAVHRATEQTLRSMFSGIFNYNATRKFDFVDKETGQAIELTTKKGIGTHSNRGADFVTYD